ncbi:hypothetical protein POVWA2_002510 [Plasmodium ovale wallikeri]|uniref:Uncharacterized protein n=1 Tax=Plasmodium ovale wallikeri TaxID=864142 RepID=A0A1A8YH64_PLAOA|nr:hypothetical protein POVWA1_002570 [Plasmodium ovale wallikeri]SBT31138.1 hypothetical protein POVWA2_002510 [Plasmodium ovale wallikeri]
MYRYSRSELRYSSALWDASLEVGRIIFSCYQNFLQVLEEHIGECDSLIFEFVDPGVGKFISFHLRSVRTRQGKKRDLSTLTKIFINYLSRIIVCIAGFGKKINCRNYHTYIYIKSLKQYIHPTFEDKKR